MKTVVEHLFTGEVTTTYDTGKTYIGSGNFIKQYTGTNPSDKYISPFKLSVARPMEAATAISCSYPWVYSWSSTVDWVFFADIAATTTKRVALIEYNKTTNEFSWKGFVTFTGPGGNMTARGFRMGYYKYSTGTVGVSTTAVSGSGTTWSDIRFASGSRIGFGSTDPTQISTWYVISSIDTNTGITLTSTAGTITSGTSYVIEEIRAYYSITNATTTNGGLFVIKGLNYGDFNSAGTSISTATNVDNIKALYWLADAATVTMTASWGLSLDTCSADFTTQDCYIMNGTVSANGYNFFKYNVRAPLTGLSAGKTTSAYLYKTGNINSALTGTIIQTNNGRLATLNHGVASGVTSLFFCTTTRIYRCPITQITNGGTSYLSDSMVEIPPGGTSTYVASTFSSVEGSSVIDKLIIGGAAANRCYISDYYTDSTPLDMIFLANDIQYDHSSSDSGAPVHPTTNATVMSFYSENGFLYIARGGTTAALNQIYCLPLLAQRTWADDTGEYVITPKLSTQGAIKFYRIYVNSTRQLGSFTFGVPTEDFDILYRVDGIDNNSGLWTLLTNDGDLSSIASSNSIQFKIRFKVIGTFCVPSRIYSLSVVYEDSTTDSHYSPSINKSNVTSRIFAYRQSTAWGSNIPNLRIRLYNATTGSLVLDDTVSLSSYGIWQYSTNSTDWSSWSSSADSVGNYIRYTATTLPAGIIVRALLTQ